MHYSHHIYGFFKRYATTFNNFDFLGFDNLNLSIAIFNDFNLLVLNNLQFFLCMIKFQMLRLCICKLLQLILFFIGTHFAIATNFTKVEVMQLAIIQVQAQVWESHVEV
jgi:hypothetical protein